MRDWRVSAGDFLFKYRSFTQLPLMLSVFIFFRPQDRGAYNVFIDIAGLIISVAGEFIRIITVGYAYEGTSGRESYLRADALNTSGIYSIVRNPLYIANFFIFSGLAVVFSNWITLIVFALCLILQYYFIIHAEEEFLKKKYSRDYEDYCRKVNRIFPRFKYYCPNRVSFNLKKVVFKENDSVFNMLMTFILLILYKEYRFIGRIHRPYIYAVCAGFLITGYIIIKIIKKKISKVAPGSSQ